MAKRKARGFAGGGLIVGRGTGTSDDIQRRVPVGSYIMPAAVTEEVGADALDQMGADVLVSNGEYQIPPEQVMAVGIQTLDAIRGDDSVRGFHGRPAFASGGPVLPDDETRRRMSQDSPESQRVRERAQKDSMRFQSDRARADAGFKRAASTLEGARATRAAPGGLRPLVRGTAALSAIPEAIDVGRVATDPGSSKIDVATQAAEGAGRVAATTLGAAGGMKTGALIGSAGGPLSVYTVPAGALIGGLAGGWAGYKGYDAAVDAGRRAAGVDERSPVDRIAAPQESQVGRISAPQASQVDRVAAGFDAAPRPVDAGVPQGLYSDPGAPRGLQSPNNVRALDGLFDRTRVFGDRPPEAAEQGLGASGIIRDSDRAAWERQMRDNIGLKQRRGGRAGRAQQALDLRMREIGAREAVGARAAEAGEAVARDANEIALRRLGIDEAEIAMRQRAAESEQAAKIGAAQAESALVDAYVNAETKREKDGILRQIMELRGQQQDLRKNFMKVNTPLDPDNPMAGSRETLVDLRTLGEPQADAPRLKDGTPISSLKEGEAIVVPDRDTKRMRRFIMRNGVLVDEETGSPAQG